DVQKSVPVKLARLLLDITIGCCFDSHPRIDSVLQNSGFRYGLLENAIGIYGRFSSGAGSKESHEGTSSIASRVSMNLGIDGRAWKSGIP
ncbi:MAG: hypothetical protein ACK5GN_10330, partial [Pseudomonadota bacterium]